MRFSILFALMAWASGVSTIFAQDLVSAPLNVGIVFDKGGKDDKSFNTGAFNGAMKAKKDLGVYVKYIEAMDDSAYETSLRAFASAQKDYGLIIAIGITQMDAVKKIAKKFPHKKFAVVDAPVTEYSNVRALLFQEHEGSFLVGAAAALAAPSGRIGFIGGMDIPLIRRFEKGYLAGARAVRPQAQCDSHYIGVTSEAWNNPAKAKELALSEYASGAEVIFAAAGASNTGLFDAAEEKHRLAIGVDSNQDWVKPGFILTSMLKRVDQAVYDTIEDTLRGKFSAGVKYYGLQNLGVDYSADQYNEKILTPEMRQKLEALKADILAGRIRVPDYYQSEKSSEH
jgi:basic membrane protein A and related proteins